MTHATDERDVARRGAWTALVDRGLAAVVAVHRMDEDAWARHANPWSLWTRVATLPLAALALWSVHWIGWRALLPIAAVVAWSYVSPRLFPPPGSTRSWAARATLGERVYLARGAVPIPPHHARTITAITVATAVGTGLFLAGLLLADPGLYVGGGLAALFGKLWFCDRMVWLYGDMAVERPEYAAWLK